MARMMVHFGFYDFAKLLNLTRLLLNGLDDIGVRKPVKLPGLMAPGEGKLHVHV